MWKWNDQHVTIMRQRKNLSPRQDSNLRPPKHRAGALFTWATEDSWRARPIIGSSAGRVSNMNLVYGLALHEFFVAQVNRAPARCLGGHRFESCRGLRSFLCPMLETFWSFHFHICFTEHKIYHLPFFHHLITCFRHYEAVLTANGQPHWSKLLHSYLESHCRDWIITSRR